MGIKMHSLLIATWSHEHFQLLKYPSLLRDSCSAFLKERPTEWVQNSPTSHITRRPMPLPGPPFPMSQLSPRPETWQWLPAAPWPLPSIFTVSQFHRTNHFLGCTVSSIPTLLSISHLNHLSSLLSGDVATALQPSSHKPPEPTGSSVLTLSSPQSLGSRDQRRLSVLAHTVPPSSLHAPTASCFPPPHNNSTPHTVLL